MANLPPENRVKHADYGSIPRGDSRLVAVPSSGKQQFLHWYVANKFDQMSRAAVKAGHDPLLVASGWRPPLWATEAAYNADMIAQYGSVAEGKKWRAFKSPHMTGLAVDFGSGGLRPSRKTNAQQKQTALYAWLLDNAASYGFSPYHREAWHWEAKIPTSLFKAEAGWGLSWAFAGGMAVGALAAALGRRG